MKKRQKFFTIILMIPILLSITYGKIPVVNALRNDVVYDRIIKDGKIRIGTSAPFSPYEFYDKDNNLQGLDIEIGKKIAEKLSVAVEFINMPFDALLASLQTGKIDIVISDVTPTEERRQTVDFSDIYYTSQVGVLIKKDNASKFPTLQSFEGSNLGAQAGTIQEILATEDLKAKNVSALQEVSTLAINLQNGKIDGLVVEDTVGKELEKQYPEFVFSKEMMNAGDAAIALPKNAPKIKEEVNNVIFSLKENNEIQTMYDAASKLSQGITSEQVDKTALSSVVEYMPLFVQGAAYTVLIALLAIIIGSIIGMLFVFGRDLRYVGFMFRVVIAFLRGTPLLVQLFLFTYVIFGVWIPLDKIVGSQGYLFVAALTALGLNSGAYISEIMRAGIAGVDKGQFEAGRSLGLSRIQTMKSVVLPQAIKNILPALGNEFVVIIKESAIVSTIGVLDIMRASQIMTSKTYSPFVPLLMAACIYFILTFGMSRLVTILERRLAVSDHN